MTQHGVRLDENYTTMTLPHKRIELGGKLYFVATFPEGDLTIHEWSRSNQHGYGDSEVSFLLEDGSVETVKGPFSCGDAFDFGRSRKLSEVLGIPEAPAASRIIIGPNLWPYSGKVRQVTWQEECRSCEPLDARLDKAFRENAFPKGVEVEISYRNSNSYLRPEDIRQVRERAGA